jgi:RNA polymerase sigma-70 factor (ECF subfamily)
MNKYSALTWDSMAETRPTSNAELSFLIERCLSGDESAYVILYERHFGLVYRLAYSLLQNRQDAEEVLQDSFEYAFRKLADFDENKSAFTTWLYRITVSRCRNKRRRKWLPTLPLTLLRPHGVKDKNVKTPDELLEQTEMRRDVWNALGQLSPKLRETTVLRYYYGMQYKEIGAILNISPKTAESRMRLAHKKLRGIIELMQEDQPE